MNFIRFLFSKIFFKQIVLASVIVFIICISTLYILKIITNHNKYIKVPNLESFSLKESEFILKKNNLRFEVLDSSKYNPNYPPLSVIDQSPVYDDLVKKNRKIYLTLNPKSYRKIRVPDVIQITQSYAETKLQAVGFKIGGKTYKNDIGKDMVLEINYQGKKIDPGVLLPKNSSIDLILGNGKK